MTAFFIFFYYPFLFYELAKIPVVSLVATSLGQKNFPIGSDQTCHGIDKCLEKEPHEQIKNERLRLRQTNKENSGKALEPEKLMVYTQDHFPEQHQISRRILQDCRTSPALLF
jgi:hypothetical protein